MNAEQTGCRFATPCDFAVCHARGRPGQSRGCSGHAHKRDSRQQTTLASVRGVWPNFPPATLSVVVGVRLESPEHRCRVGIRNVNYAVFPGP